MTALAPQIADYARRLFDVVGIRRLSGDESLLVLGLVLAAGYLLKRRERRAATRDAA